MAPGEGARRAGHDGRAGDRIAAAGTRLAPRHALLAARTGVLTVPVRQPRVAVALDDPGQAAFARRWLSTLGAAITDGPADLTLRPATEHAPRLALAPAETAWLQRDAAGLVLKVPMRASADQERLILATGRYIGEGFDDARLDTLFLTMPIAWKGTLAQYVGRLHREHHGKKDVLVVDYVDDSVPVLQRMARKRRAGYHALGYSIEASRAPGVGACGLGI